MFEPADKGGAPAPKNRIAAHRFDLTAALAKSLVPVPFRELKQRSVGRVRLLKADDLQGSIREAIDRALAQHRDEMKRLRSAETTYLEELEAVKRSFESQIQALETSRADGYAIRAELEAARSALPEVRERADRAEAECARLQAELATREVLGAPAVPEAAEPMATAERTDRFGARERALVHDRVRLERELETSRAALETARAEVERLRAELEGKIREADRLGRELTREREGFSDLARERQRFEGERDEARGRLAQALVERERIRIELVTEPTREVPIPAARVAEATAVVERDAAEGSTGVGVGEGSAVTSEVPVVAAIEAVTPANSSSPSAQFHDPAGMPAETVAVCSDDETPAFDVGSLEVTIRSLAADMAAADRAAGIGAAGEAPAVWGDDEALADALPEPEIHAPGEVTASGDDLVIWGDDEALAIIVDEGDLPAPDAEELLAADGDRAELFAAIDAAPVHVAGVTRPVDPAIESPGFQTDPTEIGPALRFMAPSAGDPTEVTPAVQNDPREAAGACALRFQEAATLSTHPASSSGRERAAETDEIAVALSPTTTPAQAAESAPRPDLEVAPTSPVADEIFAPAPDAALMDASAMAEAACALERADEPVAASRAPALGQVANLEAEREMADASATGNAPSSRPDAQSSTAPSASVALTAPGAPPTVGAASAQPEAGASPDPVPATASDPTPAAASGSVPVIAAATASGQAPATASGLALATSPSPAPSDAMAPPVADSPTRAAVAAKAATASSLDSLLAALAPAARAGAKAFGPASAAASATRASGGATHGGPPAASNPLGTPASLPELSALAGTRAAAEKAAAVEKAAAEKAAAEQEAVERPASPTASLAKLAAAPGAKPGPRVAFFGFGGNPFGAAPAAGKSEPRNGSGTWRKPDRRG